MARWDRIRSTGNVQDRRGIGGRPGIAIGGLGGLGAIILVVITLLGGGTPDLEQTMDQLSGGEATGEQSAEFAGIDDYEQFTARVLGSTDELWNEVFTNAGLTYVEPTLALFRSSTTSACGEATSAIGPHYCPLDETIYIDETFYDELTSRFGAQGGDVAEAYVMAHEVGHHVSKRLGVMDQVRTAQQSAGSQEEVNQLSVRLELQADCFAGIWAHSLRDAGVFETGEIAEAIDAAAAVGDDRIQERVQGQITPETWTHGSSDQRVQWFNTGYESGDPTACNTFG